MGSAPQAERALVLLHTSAPSRPARRGTHHPRDPYFTHEGAKGHTAQKKELPRMGINPCRQYRVRAGVSPRSRGLGQHHTQENSSERGWEGGRLGKNGY